MQLESVFSAVSEAELLGAWKSYLTQLISESEVLGFCVRWIFSEVPPLGRSLSLGEFGDNALCQQRRVPTERPEVVMRSGAVPLAVVGLADVPVTVGVSSSQGAAAVEVLEQVCARAVFVRALVHSFRVLEAHLSVRKSMLLASGEATVILDERGVVHGRNEAAILLFEKLGDVVRWGDDHHLKFVSQKEDRIFGRALAELFEGDTGGCQRVMFGQELMVVLRANSNGGVEGERIATAMLRKLSMAIEVDADELVHLLQVSPLQARLAQALLRGDSIIEHAREIGSSESTVRWHLARLMDALGCRRQSDVVLKLARMFG